MDHDERGGSLKNYNLLFLAPVRLDTLTIKNIPKRLPKPHESKKVTLEVLSAEIERGIFFNEPTFCVRLRFQGAAIDRNLVRILDAGGKPIPDFRFWGSSSEFLELRTAAENAKGNVGSYRVEFQVPEKVAFYEMKANFENFQLTRDRDDEDDS